MGDKKSAKQDSRAWKAQRRRARAVGLRAQGLTDREIAKRVGVCFQTVSKWMREEDARLKQILEVGKHYLIREQLAALQEAQRMAFSGFKKSLRDAEETTITETPDGTTTSTKRRGQSGNPSYLAQVVATSNRLAQMLGLDAPPQTPQPPASTSPTTARVVTIVRNPKEAERLRDEHLIYVEAEEVQEIPQASQAADPGPPSAADGEAGPVPEPDKPRKGVRRRPRRRKD
jgi:transcriptional regulator with XRE-family HTH domain